MAKKSGKEYFGYSIKNLSRQKVLPSTEPTLSEYDYAKGYYNPMEVGAGKPKPMPKGPKGKF
jgi:hypothetical protein